MDENINNTDNTGNIDTNYKGFIKEYKYEILLSLICILR